MTGTMVVMNQKQLEWVAAAVLSARLEAGLSKEAAARKAEVSTITYKRVEDGLAVRDSSLAKIGSALGVDAPGMSKIQTGGSLAPSGSVSAAGDDEPEFEFLTRVREDLTTEEMDQLMKEATPYLEMLVRDIKSRNRD